MEFVILVYNAKDVLFAVVIERKGKKLPILQILFVWKEPVVPLIEQKDIHSRARVRVRAKVCFSC